MDGYSHDVSFYEQDKTMETEALLIPSPFTEVAFLVGMLDIVYI